MPRSPGFVEITNKAKEQIKEITLEEVEQMKCCATPPVIVDVREKSEWDQGHVPEAIHLSKGIIERDIETTILDKDKPIVLYCGGGSRSALATLNVQMMGYRNVMSLVGGYRGWLAAQEEK